MTRVCWAPALLAASSVLVACSGGNASGGGRSTPVPAGASHFVVATPDWAGSSGLEWRAVASTGSQRWLLRADGTSTLEVDVATRATSTPAPGAWERAAGAVARGAEVRIRASQLTSAHVREGRLVLGGAPVATHHATLLDAVVSPGGRSIAVLSADGAKPSLHSPLGGGANAAGPHAVEVFDLATGLRTALVPLSITSESIALIGHWSGDESLLIYTDALLTRLCFVRLP